MTLTTAGAALATATSYLLTLVAAARTVRAPAPQTALRRDPCRYLIVVPAHDEERVIGTTLSSLAALDHPQSSMTVVVIADNCSDGTARVAERLGARALVRRDAARRGKGHALAWGLGQLGDEIRRSDAVVFVDADCECSSNLLQAFDVRLHAGITVAQAGYWVANPADSWPAALRWAAFALVNVVRPRGAEALGLSCGILGTGFMVGRDVLERVRWEAFSLAEDQEYHLRLIDAGERVHFVHEAAVTSPMPTSLAASREQNLRWEAGRWTLARRWTPSLIREGMRRRDRVRLHAALEQLVPPQSVLLSAHVVVMIGAVLLRARAARAMAALSLLGQATFVLGGLRVARAPAHVYAALLHAPVLVLWKVWLLLQIALRRGPRSWVATRADAGPRG
jgi:hypothetical protein